MGGASWNIQVGCIEAFSFQWRYVSIYVLEIHELYTCMQAKHLYSLNSSIVKTQPIHHQCRCCHQSHHLSQTFFTFCIYRITFSSLKVLAIVLMVNFVNDSYRYLNFWPGNNWKKAGLSNCKQNSESVCITIK